MEILYMQMDKDGVITPITVYLTVYPCAVCYINPCAAIEWDFVS